MWWVCLCSGLFVVCVCRAGAFVAFYVNSMLCGPAVSPCEPLHYRCPLICTNSPEITVERLHEIPI